MKLSQFKFDLNPKRLAQYPSKIRDESRLMVLHKETGEIEHKVFKDVLDYFDEGDVMVPNNTRVFPARLFGNKEKTGASIEVFLLRELNKDVHLWDVLVDPARKIRVGNKLYFGENEDLVAEVIDNTTSRGRTIKFIWNDEPHEFYEAIERLGHTPLPKYITRPTEPEDAERYQTIFASETGAVAAPTAGLHFTPHVLKRMELKGIEIANITLHVGLGTFRPVEVEDLTKHKMDSEGFSISDETAAMVNKALDNKKKVCAIGTTSIRSLESAVTANDRLKGHKGWTDKFIFPPYEFKIPSALITNFHTPQSTLLMMTAAFGGYDNVMNAYEVAVKEKYKFFSYGDAMLII